MHSKLHEKVEFIHSEALKFIPHESLEITCGEEKIIIVVVVLGEVKIDGNNSAVVLDGHLV
eukprot:scaffold338008_cov67-Attheya_sp.AAC.1